jgi:hypothetical protein
MSPATGGGWLAVGLFALGLVLLAARLVLTPALGLGLNYLMVGVALSAAALAAVFAVAFRRERAIGVIAVLVLSVPALIFLIAELIGKP